MFAMNVKDSLDQALKEAMKSQDDVARRTLRMVRAAIKNAEIDGGRPLEESDIFRILQKEVKSRRETIADAQKAGRADMINDAEAEIAVLERFLPQSLSPAELEALARAAIAEVGATSAAHMGQVMRVLMPKVQGRADGRQISDVVRRLLGQG
ncbi:MAG: GatB/YqeY domain-containing protein [Anaerolineales bacterium]